MTSAMERVEPAEVGGEVSGSEQFLVQDARARRSPWRAAGGAGVAVLLLAGAGAGAARLAPRGAASDMDRLQSKVQTVAMPPRDKCAASDEDSPPGGSPFGRSTSALRWGASTTSMPGAGGAAREAGFTPGTMSQILCVQVTQIAPLQGWPAWEKQAGLVASFGGATSRCQTHRERHRE